MLSAYLLYLKIFSELRTKWNTFLPWKSQKDREREGEMWKERKAAEVGSKGEGEKGGRKERGEREREKERERKRERDREREREREWGRDWERESEKEKFQKGDREREDTERDSHRTKEYIRQRVGQRDSGRGKDKQGNWKTDYENPHNTTYLQISFSLFAFFLQLSHLLLQGLQQRENTWL